MTDSVHVEETGGWRGERNVVLFVCLSPLQQFTIVASLVSKVQGWWHRAGTDPTRENGGTAKRFPFVGLSLAYKQVSCQTRWMQLLFPKIFTLLPSELTNRNCFADTKNKLSRKTFYSVFYEELELWKSAAAVPCAFNTSLSQNRELCVLITWLHFAHIFSLLS